MPIASSAEAAVEELLQATWQLLRRLRAESNTEGLSWSQTGVIGQLRKHGPMTTADLARAESVKPQSMGATLACARGSRLGRAPTASKRRTTSTFYADAQRDRNERSPVARKTPMAATGARETRTVATTCASRRRRTAETTGRLVTSAPAIPATRAHAFGFTFVTPLALGSALNPINSTMIATALVPIATSLHVSAAQVGWLIAGLYLASAIAQPTMGRLADLFGPRRVFLCSLVLVALAGTIGCFRTR